MRSSVSTLEQHFSILFWNRTWATIVQHKRYFRSSLISHLVPFICTTIWYSTVSFSVISYYVPSYSLEYSLAGNVITSVSGIGECARNVSQYVTQTLHTEHCIFHIGHWLICILISHPFIAVGCYYHSFRCLHIAHKTQYA